MPYSRVQKDKYNEEKAAFLAAVNEAVFHRGLIDYDTYRKTLKLLRKPGKEGNDLDGTVSAAKSTGVGKEHL